MGTAWKNKQTTTKQNKTKQKSKGKKHQEQTVQETRIPLAKGNHGSLLSLWLTSLVTLPQSMVTVFSESLVFPVPHEFRSTFLFCKPSQILCRKQVTQHQKWESLRSTGLRWVRAVSVERSSALLLSSLIDRTAEFVHQSWLCQVFRAYMFPNKEICEPLFILFILLLKDETVKICFLDHSRKN